MGAGDGDGDGAGAGAGVLYRTASTQVVTHLISRKYFVTGMSLGMVG